MRVTRTRVAIFFLSAFLLLLGIAVARAESSPEVCGHVIDASTRKPIEGAWVVSGEEATRTNREGRFALHRKRTWIGVRAAGYVREQVAPQPDMRIALRRLEVL